MSSNKSALTLRAALIASFLSLFLLASTSYIALKIGAAPWPVIFSVVVSGGLLKLLDRGRKTDIHEVNVAQAGASIGGLVAAGVSFTIPGIIFLQQAGQTDLQIPDLLPLSLLCVGAAVLGILLAIPMKATFVDEEQLPYPAGTAGAELLKLGKTGGRELRLITALGASAALFALLRDVYFPAGFALSFLVPAGIFITLLPMPLAIGSGYILGPRASFSWMGGAAVGWLIIVPLLVNNGMAAATAPVWVQNLGMGMVLGSGVGFFLSYVVPRIKRIFGPFFDARSNGKWWISLAVLPAVAILLWTGVPPLAVFITLAGTWMMVAVAARMTGETNINPLEQFGIFVGLLVSLAYALMPGEIPMAAVFMVVVFVSVACAVAGDAGHDFKSAVIIGTSFRDVVRVDLITAVVSGAAAPVILGVIFSAFQSQLFSDIMPAPQARMVAGSISGFAFPLVFWSGFALALVGEFINSRLPGKWQNLFLIMPFGIGLFLGVGLALPIALGAWIRMRVEGKYPNLYGSILLMAAGVMGGEGIAGFAAGALTIAGLNYAQGAAILGGIFGLILLLALIRKPGQS